MTVLLLHFAAKARGLPYIFLSISCFKYLVYVVQQILDYSDVSFYMKTRKTMLPRGSCVCRQTTVYIIYFCFIICF